MVQPEDISPEAAIRELAEILASGYLRTMGHDAVLGDNPAGTRGAGGITANNTNGCG